MIDLHVVKSHHGFHSSGANPTTRGSLEPRYMVHTAAQLTYREFAQNSQRENCTEGEFAQNSRRAQILVLFACGLLIAHSQATVLKICISAHSHSPRQ